MKKLGLALVLLMIVAGSASATVCHIELYPGTNMIALPNAPYEVGHYDATYGMFVYNPYYIFGYFDGGPNPEGMQGLDATTNIGMFFGNDFNMLLGQGFYYQSDGRYTLTYNGVPDGVPDSVGNQTDMLIALPGVQGDGKTDPNPNPAQAGGGLHMIGHPFAHQTPVAVSEIGDNIFFTDGTVMKNWAQAMADGWVDSQFESLDPTTNIGQFVTPDTAGGDLLPGHSYFLRTYKDNIAVIIPATPNDGPGTEGWDE